MLVKPTQSTIIETYTLDEILDLVKEKSRVEKEEQIHTIREQLDKLASSKRLEPTTTTVIPEPSTSVPEQKKTIQKAAVVIKSKPLIKRRARNSIPLKENILSILGKKPMKIDEILVAVERKGWKTTAKEPKRLINLELNKLLKNKKIKKVERGIYTSK